MPIPKGPDGLYHPSSEPELIELVQLASSAGRQLRVRGAAHSVSRAIYPDPMPVNTVGVHDIPDSDAIVVMLDQYHDIVRVEGDEVTVQAGIRLGEDPFDHTHTGTLERSLLKQLHDDYGLTLSDLGGITHQSVGGFVSSGSSGGSLRYGIRQNIHGLRIIDGTGTVHDLRADDPDPSRFHAAGVSMGLLGALSTITFKCEPTYGIAGFQSTTTIDGAAFDLFGEDPDKPGLEQLLRDSDYVRLLWYPQRGADRLVTWQARRVPLQTGFVPVPFAQFGDDPSATQLAISILNTVVGNLDDLSAAEDKLDDNFDRLEEILELDLSGPMGDLFALLIRTAVELGVDAAILALTPFVPLLKAKLPEFMAWAVRTFVPLEDQAFIDVAWHGLPMDNAADDVLLGTGFTEIWMPVTYAERVTRLLRDWFADGDDDEALAKTGTYAWEIYGAIPSPFWMSQASSTGSDEWKDGIVRVDVFWWLDNAGDPVTDFFPPIWKLLRDAQIPFRLHWGKWQPDLSHGDPDGWVDFFREQYPRWHDFLALREQLDPDDVYLSSYWKERLGC